MLEIRSLVISSVISFASYYKLNDVKVKTYSTLVSSAISYIENNVRINLSVSDIARELFVSESKLRNKFVAEMGIPIGKYIDDMIFIKARQLLSSADTTISEVSAALGFCDQFYFSRRFKEKFNLTPSEFRKVNKIY
jgi:AraC-like DNA-binding protein